MDDIWPGTECDNIFVCVRIEDTPSQIIHYLLLIFMTSFVYKLVCNTTDDTRAQNSGGVVLR